MSDGLTPPNVRLPDARLADWVDGTLSPREHERFVAELRVNPQLRADLAAYERTVAALRGAYAPGPGDAEAAQATGQRLAAQVLAKLADAPAARPSWQRRSAGAWAWGLSLAAAVLACAFLVDRLADGPIGPDAAAVAQGAPSTASDGAAFRDEEGSGKGSIGDETGTWRDRLGAVREERGTTAITMALPEESAASPAGSESTSVGEPRPAGAVATAAAPAPLPPTVESDPTARLLRADQSAASGAAATEPEPTRIGLRGAAGAYGPPPATERRVVQPPAAVQPGSEGEANAAPTRAAGAPGAPPAGDEPSFDSARWSSNVGLGGSAQPNSPDFRSGSPDARSGAPDAQLGFAGRGGANGGLPAGSPQRGGVGEVLPEVRLQAPAGETALAALRRAVAAERNRQPGSGVIAAAPRWVHVPAAIAAPAAPTTGSDDFYLGTARRQPVAAADEVWLVEGSREEVGQVLARLAAAAREHGAVLVHGEVQLPPNILTAVVEPVVPPADPDGDRPAPRLRGSAAGNPTAPAAGAGGGPAAGGARTKTAGPATPGPGGPATGGPADLDRTAPKPGGATPDAALDRGSAGASGEVVPSGGAGRGAAAVGDGGQAEREQAERGLRDRGQGDRVPGTRGAAVPGAPAASREGAAGDPVRVVVRLQLAPR